MSRAFGNGDLQLMAEYDFKTPIEATVIIYDSDEDNKPSDEKEQNSNDVNKNTNNTISDTFKHVYEANNIMNHETANTSTKRRTSCELNNAKKSKVSENVTEDSNIELVFQNLADVLDMNHTVNNIDSNKNIHREVQSVNSHQMTTTTLQGNSESHTLPTFPQITPQITFPQKDEDLNKKVNACIQTILDTVSTHMIFIMQTYMYYRSMTFQTSDKAVLDVARTHYQQAKSRYFYLSFSAVSNIMLPKENDKAFVENFINNTIKLANSKHLYFKHSDMKLLCAEMFHWTKSHVRNPVLSELLNKDQPNVLTTNSYKTQECNNATNALDNTACVFRSGPAGREVTINLNTAVVPNRQSTMLQSHNISHDSTQNVPSRQIALPPYTSITARDELRNNGNPRNYMQEFQNFNTSYDSNSIQLPNQTVIKNKPTRRRQTKKVQTKTQHQPATPLQTPRPPSYYSMQNWHHETVPQVHSEEQIIHSGHSFQADQGHEDVYRSLSRDSGFMSPVCSVANDHMCTSPRYDHHTDPSLTSVTPMITHVTSLNPSVAFIKDGICHVCGKLTKQKCLGCLKFYYCSHQCQIDDWKYHVFICK